MPTNLRRDAAPAASRSSLDLLGPQASGKLDDAPGLTPLHEVPAASSPPAPGLEASLDRAQAARASHAGVDDAARAHVHHGSASRRGGQHHTHVQPSRALDRASAGQDFDANAAVRDIASSVAAQSHGEFAADVLRLLQMLGFDGRSLSSIELEGGGAQGMSGGDLPEGLDLEQLMALVGAAMQRERGARAHGGAGVGSGAGAGSGAALGSAGAGEVGRSSGGVHASGQTNDPAMAAATSSTAAGKMSGLLSFIAAGEGGYNSMNQGTRGGRIVGSTHNAASKLGKDLTDMTIGQVMAAQRSGRLFAAGRYQFIPSTMKGIVGQAGLSTNDKFSPEHQDKLGVALIQHKRPYAYGYITGQHNDRRGAMLALAQEWASLPDPRTGRSFYGNGNQSSHSVAAAATAIDAARRGWQMNHPR